MVKRGRKKTTTKKTKSSGTIINKSVDRILIENFVNLQKAITNLAVKFEGLSDNIGKLLNLFEISAKSFAEKTPQLRDVEKDKEFLDKLNVLLDQNKTIAKGLTLMEEKLRGRVYGSQPSPNRNPTPPSQYQQGGLRQSRNLEER